MGVGNRHPPDMLATPGHCYDLGPTVPNSLEEQILSLLRAKDWKAVSRLAAQNAALVRPCLIRALLHQPPFDEHDVREVFGEVYRGGQLAAFNSVLSSLLEHIAEGAVAELTAALQDSRWDVYEQASLALTRAGPAAAPAVPVFMMYLAHPRRRLRAIDALTHIGRGAELAVPMILEQLKSDDSVVRYRCVAALVAIGIHRADVRGALRHLATSDDDEDVRTLAAAAL